MRNVIAMTAWVAMVVTTAFAQQPATTAPDEIFYNGKVVTVDRDFDVVQAFAVKGDQFVAVGTNAAVRKLAGPKTRLTNLNGRTVVPGLMDSHNHQYMAAMLDRGTDMTGI